QVGPPEEVYARPANAFVAGILGWPPIALLDGALVGEAGRLTFVSDRACLPVPEAVAPAWEEFVGRELTLGLPAEHVALGAREGEAGLDMEVAQVEPLGGARRVVLRRGAWVVSAQVREGPTPAPGDGARVALGLAQAHLFERGTGRALAHGAAPPSGAIRRP